MQRSVPLHFKNNRNNSGFKMFYIRKRLKYVALLVFVVLMGCGETNSFEQEIGKVDVDFTVERFDRAFANAKSNDLPKLKETFPFLFNKSVPDSVWVARIEDTLQHQLLNEVNKTFGDFKNTSSELKSLFQHCKLLLNASTPCATGGNINN